MMQALRGPVYLAFSLFITFFAHYVMICIIRNFYYMLVTDVLVAVVTEFV